jgi:hypothetical protein
VVGGYSSVTALTFGARDSADEQAPGIGGEPMQQRRTAEAPAPPRTYRPLRQIVVYLCITYGLTLAIALALPHAGIAPLIAIAVPVIAVALTVAFTVPRGQRCGLGGGRIQPAEGTGSAHRRPRTGGNHCPECRRRGRLRGSPISRPASGLRQGRSQRHLNHCRLRGRISRRGDRLAGLSAFSRG